jgi:hypothetical protein
VDAGAFQRLQEARRQADGDAVLVPDLLAAPGAEFQEIGLVGRLAVQGRSQGLQGRVVVDVLGRIDIARADPVLQRDAPHPAGRMGGGAGEGRQAIAAHLALVGHGAVVGQPVVPVLEAGLQRPLDQQGAEARAVDEQVGLQHLAAVGGDRLDEAVLAAQGDVDHLALAPDHAALLGVVAQVAGIEAGVEMEGVFQARQHLAGVLAGQHELAQVGRRGRQVEVVDRLGRAVGLGLQPDLVELQASISRPKLPNGCR